jgi:hypothetical protein
MRRRGRFARNWGGYIHLLIGAVLLFFVEAGYCRTIYVATNGSDANAGTTQTAPVLTLERAHTIASDGDTIALQSGTYITKTILTKKVTVLSQGGSVLFNSQTSNFFVEAGPSLKTDTATPVRLDGRAYRDGQLLSLEDVSVQWTWIGKKPAAVQRSPSWRVFNPTLRISSTGEYNIYLSVTERDGLRRTATDSVSIKVDNRSCTLDLGKAQNLVLQPGGVCTTLKARFEFEGTANPASATYLWTRVPVQLGGGPVIKNPHSPTTEICFPSSGTFVFELSATKENCSIQKTVSVTVVPIETCNPTSSNLTITTSAGQTLVLPSTGSVCETFTAILAVVSPDSFTWSWRRKSGPLPQIQTPNSRITSICFPTKGNYVLDVIATKPGFCYSNNIAVTVHPPADSFITSASERIQFCCSSESGFHIGNTHPTCRIDVKVRSFCLEASGESERSISLEPGEYRNDFCGFLRGFEAQYACALSELPYRSEKILLPETSEASLQAGTIQFLVEGLPDSDYWVEASQDLVNWQRISTVKTETEPVWTQDLATKAFPYRFYRMLLVDPAADTDGDGVPDGVELQYPSAFNPLDPTDVLKDSDGDGLTNGAEVNVHHTNPEVTDADTLLKEAISREVSVFNFGSSDKPEAIAREVSVFNFGPEDKPEAVSREVSLFKFQ